jgi:hypothetical protein
MKNLILAIFAIALIESITSCKKTEDTVDAPFVTIWTPTVAQNFVAGDTIHFTGNAGDSEDLHEGKLRNTDKRQTTPFWHLKTSLYMP